MHALQCVLTCWRCSALETYLCVNRNARIGIIVAVVVGVALIGAVVVIIYFYCRRKQAIAETERMKAAARILGVETEVS
jgi:uncharacterized membrane-anchored protein